MKSIIKKLSVIILTCMLLAVGVNYTIQIRATNREALNNAHDLFGQIRQVLQQNEEDIRLTEKAFAKECLGRARAAAYFVEHYPNMLKNAAEMRRVARMLQVDEFHIFDETGTIYSGSEPKYYGYNFNSGEQMQFFLPMLQDKTLELCQEITPNTAEQKLMQYAAVWCENHEAIVQIGMEPERVLEAMEKKELSYIFSLITLDKSADMYAIDRETNQILGALDQKTVGKTAEEIGIEVEKFQNKKRLYTMTINGQKECCAFEETDSLILVWSRRRKELLTAAIRNTFWMTLYLLSLALVICIAIMRYLDRNIIQSIYRINADMLQITNGNLNVRLSEQPTPELTELSSHVNEMVKSILNTTDKMSLVLRQTQLPIAVYEYNQGVQGIRVTSRMRKILGLGEEDGELFLEDAVFRTRINAIRSNPVEGRGNTFRVPGEERYLRIESFDYDKGILGIVIDVTESVLERRTIEQERDVDLLTGLFTRRAFYKQVEMLLQSDRGLGCSVMLMMDADGLKQVNDLYGHESGDRYLSKIAQILNGERKKGKIAARLSGDEFALFLYGYETGEELLDDIQAMQEEKKHSVVEMDSGIQVLVSFSVGCAFYPEDGTDIHNLLRVADKRMYEEKRYVKAVRAGKENR